MEQRRLTAIKTKLNVLNNGEYVKQEGFNPNYVQVSDRKFSRVRVLGTVISVFISDDGNFGSVVLDDSTDTIRLKAFKDLAVIEDLSPGDLVDVVGKVREYQGEKYILPEIVRKAEPGFELLRKLELARNKKVSANVSNFSQDRPSKPEKAEKKEQKPKDKKEKESDKGHKQLVLNVVNKVDEGDGAEYSEILEACDLDSEVIDKVINDLLSEGTCYEPRPGRIKKL